MKMKKLLIFIITVCLIVGFLVVIDAPVIKVLKTVGLILAFLVFCTVAGGVHLAGGYLVACFSLLMLFPLMWIIYKLSGFFKWIVKSVS